MTLISNLPIFGSNWYGGIPQWAGGGVVNGSPTPLWQKKLGKPILLACLREKQKRYMMSEWNLILKLLTRVW